MELVLKTEDALSKLLTIKIEYFDSLQTYLFNDLWVHEIDGDCFLKEVKTFKPLLKRQLKYGLNPEEYINKVCNRIKEKLEFLKEHKVGSLEFLQFYRKHIKPVNEITTFPSLDTDLYDEFKVSLKEGKTDDTDLYKFLVRFAEGKFNYTQYHEFQIGCLSYVLWNYYTALNELYSFALKFQENTRFMDFRNLDIEEKHDSRNPVMGSHLCHFNLDKLSVAHLFRAFLEEGIFVFDEANERNNELQMKRWVEKNCTYLNYSKERVPMKNFNREYSEAKSALNVKKHKDMIDKLISILENRKTKLKD